LPVFTQILPYLNYPSCTLSKISISHCTGIPNVLGAEQWAHYHQVACLSLDLLHVACIRSLPDSYVPLARRLSGAVDGPAFHVFQSFSVSSMALSLLRSGFLGIALVEKSEAAYAF